MKEVEVQTLDENTITDDASVIDNSKSDSDIISEHIKAATKDGVDDAKEVEGEKEDSPREDSTEEGAKEPEITAPDKAQESENEESVIKADQKEGQGDTNESEAFTPNLTFKYLREERQMPEELSKVIDSKEKEDYYRDIFHKAEGFEFVQDKREKAEGELNQVYQNLDGFYSSAKLGDFGKAWEKAELPKPSLPQLLSGFGFSEKDLIQHAYDVANKSPEQLQASKLEMEADRKMQKYEMRMQSMETAHQQQLESQVYREFDEYSQDPQYSPVVNAFDEKHGKGAFFREVAGRGAQLSQETGKIYGPRAIANDIIDRYNLSSLVGQSALSQTTNQSPEGQSAAGNKTQGQPARGNKRQEVPVIPAVDGNGSSPGQRTINTPEDLERLAKEELGISISF